MPSHDFPGSGLAAVAAGCTGDASAGWQRYGSGKCGLKGQLVALAGSEPAQVKQNPESKNPLAEGGCDASRHLLTACGTGSAPVEAAGTEPASRDRPMPASTGVAGGLDFTGRGPCRLGPPRASSERNLAPGVPSDDPGRVGFGNGLSDLSDKAPQPGSPVVRRPVRSYLRQVKCSVSFLRGQLTNHGTPRTLCLSGRTQFAPGTARTSSWQTRSKSITQYTRAGSTSKRERPEVWPAGGLGAA